MPFVLVTRVGVGTSDAKTLALLTQGFLRGVVACNRITIREAKRKGRPLPRIYESGVEYDREPWEGRLEEFADITTILRRGWADCDDLCAARVAELLEDGEPADVRVYWRMRGKRKMMHCQVRRGVCHADGTRLEVKGTRHFCPGCKQFDTGKIEDPSRFMGL